jgi:hypothetical protein
MRGEVCSEWRANVLFAGALRNSYFGLYATGNGPGGCGGPYHPLAHGAVQSRPMVTGPGRIVDHQTIHHHPVLKAPNTAGPPGGWQQKRSGLYVVRSGHSHGPNGMFPALGPWPCPGHLHKEGAFRVRANASHAQQ